MCTYVYIYVHIIYDVSDDLRRLLVGVSKVGLSEEGNVLGNQVSEMTHEILSIFWEKAAGDRNLRLWHVLVYACITYDVYRVHICIFPNQSLLYGALTE